MRWLQGAFVVVVAVTFVWSLLGILVTGPVVVRTTRQEIDATPSPARLRATVERLCGEFAPRDWEHPDNLLRAARWIAGELRSAGLDARLEPYETSAGTFHNVVARRQGRQPERGAQVIGAHYDAVVGTPGANDNASGVAVLLELARLLAGTPPPRHTQWLVAFSTEEPPFFGTPEMGSHAFASALVERGEGVSLMIALDLVGYYSDRPGSQRLPSFLLRPLYPGRGDFVAVIGDTGAGAWIELVKRGMLSTRAIPVHSFRAPQRLAPVLLSDHLSFRRLDLPGVLVTDTAFMRYPHYHAATDTPDRLDYQRMAAVAVALAGVLID